MAKATHKGTCQICGSTQKLPNGKLSKHGYTVKYGFFSGTCLGSGYAPVEMSFDRIVEVIEIVKKNIEVIGSQIEVLKVLNGNVAFFEGVEIEVTEEMVDTGRAKLPNRSRVEWLSSFGFFGSSREEIARSMNVTEVVRLERKIKSMYKYIEEKQIEIKNWEPREIVPLNAA